LPLSFSKVILGNLEKEWIGPKPILDKRIENIGVQWGIIKVSKRDSTPKGKKV